MYSRELARDGEEPQAGHVHLLLTRLSMTATMQQA